MPSPVVVPVPVAMPVLVVVLAVAMGMVLVGVASRNMTKRVQAQESESVVCSLANARKSRVPQRLRTSRDVPELATEFMDSVATTVGRDPDHGHTGVVVTDSSH